MSAMDLADSEDVSHVWPVPPLAPSEFTGVDRVTAEGLYKEFMDRYYSICEGLVRVYSERGNVVGAGVAGAVCSGNLCSGDGTVCGSGSGAAGGERGSAGGGAVGRTVADLGCCPSRGLGTVARESVGSDCQRTGVVSHGGLGSRAPVVAVGVGQGRGFGLASSTLGAKVGGLPRGPNYLRNQATRMKKKIRAEEQKRLKLVTQQGGFFAGCDEEVKKKLRDSRARVLLLENERREIEEKRKIDKLKSPAQMVEDAMRQIEFAEKCARRANDNRVAAWAAEISSISAESAARAAGYVGSSVKSSKKLVPDIESRLSEAVNRSARTSVGIVSASGRSLMSDGTTYTKRTALSWLRSYNYIEKFFDGRSDEDVAKSAFISVAEVKKYHRLKAEFGDA